MKLSMKPIGIILMSIGLLSLTSGCGKKLNRIHDILSGSSESEGRASVNPVVLTEKMSASQPLSPIDEGRLSQENALGVGRSAKGSQARHQNSILRGRTDSEVGGPAVDLNKDLGSQAKLTTPGQEVGDVSGQKPHRKGVTFSNGLQDIYFQFDSWRLTEKSRRALEVNAKWFKAHPHERINIEGHCDARGTQAYNYVLGEKRATMVQQYLGFLGVPHGQLGVTSFGKDKPKCHIYSEKCFQENRRAHFGSDLNLALQ